MERCRAGVMRRGRVDPGQCEAARSRWQRGRRGRFGERNGSVEGSERWLLPREERGAEEQRILGEELLSQPIR